MKLCIILHAHQPEGNHHWIFEKATNESYKPLLDVIDMFPNIKINLHLSGTLLEWLRINRIDVFEKLQKLVAINAVELLSGGFFEPILTSIPIRDVYGQIKMMNDYLLKFFNKSPEGIWIAERVWNPYLIPIISELGLKFSSFCQSQFNAGGLDEYSHSGSYISEFEGKKIIISPSNLELTSNLANIPVAEYVEKIKKHVLRGEKLVTFAEDAEALGMWEGLNKSAFSEQWLHKLFTFLTDPDSGVETVLIEDVVRRKHDGLAYLPSSSYYQFQEWSLKSREQKVYMKMRNLSNDGQSVSLFQHFITKGQWQAYLLKYPEINRMHKRMLNVSNSIYEKNSNSQDALIYLYKAQVNCPYWHGSFGGIYIKHLREEVFKNILLAEKSISIFHDYFGQIQEVDYYFESKKNYVYRNNAYFAICQGEDYFSIVETSLYEPTINIVNTINNYEEVNVYEDKIINAGNGTSSYPKGLFIDRVINPDIKQNSLLEIKNEVMPICDYETIKYGEGFIEGNAISDSRLRKELHFNSDSIVLNYTLNGDLRSTAILVELNLSVFKDHEGYCVNNIKDFAIPISENKEIRLKLSELSEIQLVPQYSMSFDENSSVNQEYQFSSILIRSLTDCSQFKISLENLN